MPLIGPNTPLIRESDLVSEREVHNGTESEENLEAESISNSELTQTEEKPYLTLIKNVMAKKNLNQLQPVSRKNSRKAAQSTPKRRAGSPKH